MQLGLAIRGNLGVWSREVAKVVEEGGKAALRRTAFGLRNDVRGKLRGARFKRPGLKNAVAAKVTGEGDDLEARVYSVARYRAGGLRRQPVDLVALFSEGANISAAGGRWLAVATGEGPMRRGMGGLRFATPRETADMGWKIAIVPSRNLGNMVVLGSWPGAAGARVVTHVLVRRVTLRSRYSLQQSVDVWMKKYPELLAEEINTRADSSQTLAGIEQ